MAKFYEKYTAVMNKKRTYMINGINDNLDNIISYKDLPETVIMTILPFKRVITSFGIEMGNNFEKIVNSELSRAIKFYIMIGVMEWIKV